MGIKGITSMLPVSQLTAKYFSGRKVCIDFYNFAFKVSRYCAFALLVENDVNQLYQYFRNLINRLLLLHASVMLVIDGKLLPIKALVSGPRILERNELVRRGFAYLEQKDYYSANHCFVKGFKVTGRQVRQIVGYLSNTFKDAAFSALFAPYEADYQIYYLVDLGVIDCVLSDDSDTIFCDVDCVRNFSIHRSIQGDLIKREGIQDLYEQYGGKDVFYKICLLKGNDYFPGFKAEIDEIADVLDRCNNDVIAGAVALNSRHYSLSNSRICKAIYEFYLHQHFTVVYDPITQTSVYQNDVSGEDQHILQYYFEREAIGVPNASAAQACLLASGYDRSVCNFPVERSFNYHKLKAIRAVRGFSIQQSIFQQLRMIDLRNGCYQFAGGFVADFRTPTTQAKYLEQQSRELQELFGYHRALQYVADVVRAE